MKKSYTEMFAVQQEANDWLAQDENNPKTKFGDALKRVLKTIAKAGKKYNKLVQNLNADNCMVSQEGKDKGGILLTDMGGFRFTPDGLKKLNDDIEKLDDSEIEIEPFDPRHPNVVRRAVEVPEDLTDLQRETFTGWVIEAKADAVAGD